MSFMNVLNNPTRLLKSVARRVTLVAISHGFVISDPSDFATAVNGSVMSVHSDTVCAPPPVPPPPGTSAAGGAPPCRCFRVAPHPYRPHAGHTRPLHSPST